MLFTIFTPTYNRSNELDRVYKSIVKQSYQNCEWVIMDDGSLDDTKDKVEKWINEKHVDIKYYYQNNQGRFAAYNNAIPFFSGELVLLLDSDNVLLDGALKKLEDAWTNAEKDNVSGIISYMSDENGKIYGTTFPEKIEKERIYRLYDRYGLKGDKALVFRKDLVVKYKYPVFSGEKFGGDAYVFNKMNDEYPMLLLRQNVIGHGEGQDSITNNLVLYHLKSPNGMREHYKDTLEHEKYNIRNMCKHCIGYISYSIMTNKTVKEVMTYSPRKGLTILMYPFGMLYYLRLARIKKKL